MEYQLVHTSNAEEMAEIVNRYIAQGWRPQGGLAIGGYVYFYQAMVREK